MKPSFLYVLGLLLLLSQSPPVTAAAEEQAAAQIVLRGNDKAVVARLSDEWEADENDPGVQITASRDKRDCWLIVTAVERARADESIDTLQKYAQWCLNAQLKRLDQPVVSDAKELKVNGAPAMQYEVRGAEKAGGLAVTYVVTAIQTKTLFVRALCTTRTAAYERKKAWLEEAVNGISESTGQADPAPVASATKRPAAAKRAKPITVKLKQGWVTAETIPEDFIQAKATWPDKGLFLTVTANETDRVVAKYRDLKSFAAWGRDVQLEPLDQAVATDPEELQIGGMPAIRYEIKGNQKSNARPVIVLLTVVQTKTYLAEVICRAGADSYAKDKPILLEATQTLTETPAK